MVTKFTFGKPFNTESVVSDVKASNGELPFGTIKRAAKKGNGSDEALRWTYALSDADRIFGLGETMRGINKRGWQFVSWNSDQPLQDECTKSLYGSHNFIIVFGKKTFGVFFDYPSKLTFDLGCSKRDELFVSAPSTDMNIYFITPDAAKGKRQRGAKNSSALKSIVAQLRALTGRSYVPPRWAFGFCQSRWGYENQKDIERVWKEYRKAGIPLDSICMDIDYMERYKDFTVDQKKFPDFKRFVARLKKDGVRLVPIIDAAVKKEAGYKTYEEAVKNKFCVTDKDGKPWIGGVWPGDCVFPDFLNPAAREWFGKSYKVLLDAGIEGFWNDMNEPALFYSYETLKETFTELDAFKKKSLDVNGLFEFLMIANSVTNNQKDYSRFFHNAGGKRICHKDVHNLYGYNMTRGAAESFAELDGENRKLLYSRSSFIGSHRYGGIWTGDNHSYWGDILLSMQQMASLNMTGFMFTGSDVGGFNCDTSRDLLLRWTAFSVWTPLFRNHSARGTREQEYYQFEKPEDFKSMVELRYALIPYLYSEFVKAALTDGMYFRPLAFDFADDARACDVQNQILLGNEIMLAPVYTQNAAGRHVYLPESMTEVRWQKGKIVSEKKLSKGDHWIQIAPNEIVFFVRKGKKIPLVKAAASTDAISTKSFSFAGERNAAYELYEDDGLTRDLHLDGRIRKI